MEYKMICSILVSWTLVCVSTIEGSVLRQDANTDQGVDVKVLSPTSIIVNWTLPENINTTPWSCILSVSNRTIFQNTIIRRGENKTRGRQLITDLSTGATYSISFRCFDVSNSEILTVGPLTVKMLNTSVLPTKSSSGKGELNKISEELRKLSSPRTSFVPSTTTAKLASGLGSGGTQVKASGMNGTDEPPPPPPLSLKKPKSDLDKPLWWWIAIVGGGGIALIVCLAGLILAGATFRKSRSGKVAISSNESKMAIVTDEVADTTLSDRVLRHPTVEEVDNPGGATTLRVPGPAANRVAQSGISWGSEFDVLDEPPLDCSTVNRNRPNMLSRRIPPPPPPDYSCEDYVNAPPAYRFACGSDEDSSSVYANAPSAITGSSDQELPPVVPRRVQHTKAGSYRR